MWLEEPYTESCEARVRSASALRRKLAPARSSTGYSSCRNGDCPNGVLKRYW